MGNTDVIRKALTDAQRFLGELPPPPNEANTCDWVIRPLLVALGYENHEISSQAGEISNKFPDYTILPKTDHTWYLEAKAWSLALESSHVDQAIYYAHTNGKRWVVLSNGKEWRLYDDYIQGVSRDRLVATAGLNDTDGMLRFLSALSRESILAKKVDVFANERRVREYLTNAITNPQSAVVKAIQKVIRTDLANAPVTLESIVDILNAAQSAPKTEPLTPQLISVSVPVVTPSIPDEGMAKSVIDPIFCRWKDSLQAEGRFENKHVTVKKGSRVAREPVPSYRPVFEKRIPPLVANGILIDRGEHYELAVDLEFSSPSGASDFVLGASTNGWVCWKDAHGRPIDQLCDRSKK